jgi:hypothetical protein
MNENHRRSIAPSADSNFERQASASALSLKGVSKHKQLCSNDIEGSKEAMFYQLINTELLLFFRVLNMQTPLVAESTLKEQIQEISRFARKRLLPQSLKAVHEVCLLSSPKHCQSQPSEPR